MNDGKRSARIRRATNEVYDAYFWDPVHEEFYGNDYSNYGYWTEGTRSQKEASDQLLDRLLSCVSDHGGRVLDVACGKGESTRHLESRFPPGNVFAINISGSQLRTTRKNAPRSNLCLMDASRLGYADSSFDLVVSVEAAFHFFTRRRFLEESFRVLRPGGQLVLSDVLFRRWYLWTVPCVPRENYLPDASAYRVLLSRVGFSGIQVEDATNQCWKAFRRHSVRTLPRIAWRHRRPGLALGFYQWVVAQSLGTRSYLIVRAAKE